MAERNYIKGLEAFRDGDEHSARRYFSRAMDHYERTGNDEGLRRNWKGMAIQYGVNPGSISGFFDNNGDIFCSIL